jgi:hypothetical protein
MGISNAKFGPNLAAASAGQGFWRVLIMSN